MECGTQGDTEVRKSQLKDFDVYKSSMKDHFYFIYVSLATGERMRVPLKVMHMKHWPKDEPVEGRSSYYYVSCSDMGWTPYQGYHDPMAIERVFLVPPVSYPEHVKEVLKELHDLDVPVKLTSYGNVDEEQRKFLKTEALVRSLRALHSKREISDQVLIKRLKEVEATGTIMNEYIKNLIKIHENRPRPSKPSSPIQSYTWFDSIDMDYETEVAKLRAEHLETEIKKRANPCGEIEMSPRAMTQIGSPHNVDSHTDEDLAARGKRKTAEASLMFEICAFDKIKAKTVVATLRQLGFESDESAKSCLLAIDNKIKELNALRDVVKEMQ